jgi:hypothetical protein
MLATVWLGVSIFNFKKTYGKTFDWKLCLLKRKIPFDSQAVSVGWKTGGPGRLRVAHRRRHDEFHRFIFLP